MTRLFANPEKSNGQQKAVSPLLAPASKLSTSHNALPFSPSPRSAPLIGDPLILATSCYSVSLNLDPDLAKNLDPDPGKFFSPTKEFA